jgi:predicted ATPase/class 3 adenylate cyclase
MGTVTFLFTDLAVSTRLWEEEPDAMSAALARHDETLRAAIAAHGGHVVKGRGDGVHAVFVGAADAVRASIELQRSLGAESWPVSEPLRVRVGIHTGMAELRDGDYFGSVVNRAARLEGIAHGGQIVVSQATADLVRDDLRDGIALLDLGEHRLRDLSRPERIFQIVHPDLARDFPRLASLESFGGNLPVQLTSFVGRDDDVARIVAMLDESSLVTLTGTGGVGKTRLAVQVAAEMVERFGDGAWFCELAAVDDGEAMAQAVAATLGCLQRPGLSLAESIVEYVKLRELLVVLDNCEHLLDEASDLAAAVVRSCPHVRVIATSREALDVAGERVVRVRSLDAPPASTSGDELARSAAVRLFADRALEAGADIAWDDRQLVAVGEICRRVDGIPLAIELAAARTPSMSPADVAARLDERFRLLTGKRRGRVERHQTLRATVEWSYQLLAHDERLVFDRLGVFAGTFDTPAAVAVAGDEDLGEWEIGDALSNLVGKSMLTPETGPDGTTRFAMLETLRQFARERLDECGDTDRRRRVAAEHYTTAAHEAGRGIAGPEDVQWVQRLRAELDNIRAAIGWALERDDRAEQELALRILASLEDAVRAHPDTGLGTLAAQAVAAARVSPPELRAPVLSLAAYHAWNQGNMEGARVLAEEARRDGIVPSTPNPFLPFMHSVVFEMTAGNHARAFEIANDTRTDLDTVDNPYAQALFLGGIANFEAMAGQLEQARADAERAFVLARKSSNVGATAVAHYGRAWALQGDDPAAALAAAEQYLDLYRQFDIGAGAASAVMALAGGLRARLGDDPGALELLREAVTLARDQGLRPQFAAALDWALSPLRRTGRPDVAAVLLGVLIHGPLADVGNFPGVAAARTRTLDGVRNILGDTKTDELVARGSAMSYDALVEYAIDNLHSPSARACEDAMPRLETQRETR